MYDFTTPKVWISDLASYNAGYNRGRWLYLPDYSDADALMNAVSSLLAEWDRDKPEDVTGPIEEYHISDWEGLPDGMMRRYSGMEDFRKAYGFLDLLEECRNPDAVKAAYEWDLFDGYEPDEYLDRFDECYAGTFDEKADWAADFLEGTGQVPDGHMQHYVDYEAYARDAEIGGDIDFFREGGQYHVFWAH